MAGRLIAISVLLARALGAQYAQGLQGWKAPAGEQVVRQKISCSSLHGLSGYDFTIISALAHTSAAGAPEFCRVLGQIQPEILFEVSLPANWNLRLYMFGNGGFAGEDLEATARASKRNEAVRLGFVVAQTNTGHDAEREPLGSFALTSQKLFDFGFRAVHVTADTAKKVAEVYYGARPKRSYFESCSTGGRQALVSAQRFPRDFDGIIAGAPALDQVGNFLKRTSIVNALAENPLPVDKLKPLAARIYAACDEKDGLKDGLIEDPRRCDFQPTRDLPRCSGRDGPDCFTSGQIRSLEIIYSDLVVRGRRVFPGWPVGGEIAGPDGRSGWEGRMVPSDRPTLSSLFAETFFRYVAFSRKDPAFRLSQVDFERDVPRLETARQVLDATDTDLSAFRDAGGRLLMWFGWADPQLNPMMGVEYYEAVRRRMGPGARDFFRLYMLPGVFHCWGGPGCDSLPAFGALINWVELEQAPQRLVAARLQAGKVVRTRPLCPYPQVAKYRGAGSIDASDSFICVDPNFR